MSYTPSLAADAFQRIRAALAFGLTAQQELQALAEAESYYKRTADLFHASAQIVRPRDDEVDIPPQSV